MHLTIYCMALSIMMHFRYSEALLEKMDLYFFCLYLSDAVCCSFSMFFLPTFKSWTFCCVCVFMTTGRKKTYVLSVFAFMT